MKKEPLKISLSEFDEKYFGIRTARAENITQKNLGEVMGFCKKNRVVFLIARCDTREIDAVHTMQRSGFLLMDTLIRYSIAVDRMKSPPGVEIYPVRPVRPGEEAAVRAVALEAFRGYRNHYTADERLDSKLTDEIYASMAYEACLKNEGTSIVLVCELDGELVGIDVLTNPSPGVGEAILKGLTPAGQKLGIGNSFVDPAREWYQSKGVRVLYGTTQITNSASQMHMFFLKFKPLTSMYTFHKWFD